MRAVDTNVLVRLMVRDDAAQVKAAETFIESGAWVPTLALAEAMWVLSTVYEIKPAALAKAVEMLSMHDRLTLENPEAVGAALELFRSRPSLGFSDCLILETARRAGHGPLGTFDRNLSRVSGTKKLP